MHVACFQSRCVVSMDPMACHAIAYHKHLHGSCLNDAYCMCSHSLPQMTRHCFPPHAIPCAMPCAIKLFYARDGLARIENRRLYIRRPVYEVLLGCRSKDGTKPDLVDGFVSRGEIMETEEGQKFKKRPGPFVPPYHSCHENPFDNAFCSSKTDYSCHHTCDGEARGLHQC